MILGQWIRLIKDSGSTLTDVSLAGQNNTDTITIPMASATDFIYIGQYYPFCNLFMDINTANSNAASLDVEIWNGSSWENAVDILDGTKPSTATLARKGNVAWATNRNVSWGFVEDTSSNASFELSAFTIYNLYWARIAPSANLSAGTILNRVTYAFAQEEDLQRINPEIDQYLTKWEASKTDWYEQIQVASTMVLAELKSMGIVFHNGQIHNYEDIALATAYRTLALIMIHLGESFSELYKAYMHEYHKLMSAKRFTIDVNADGHLNRSEIGVEMGWLRR